MRNKMTKLEEAIVYFTHDGHDKEQPYAITWGEKMTVMLEAARAYASLLKLAPEIAALVEAGEKATEGNFRADCKTDTGSGYSITATDVHYCRAGVAHYISEKDAKFFAQAANTRPTLKAIHDNLKMWGE